MGRFAQNDQVLQKPDLPDDALILHLRRAYDLEIAEVTFLPLGADQGTAIYRVVAREGRPYFARLRTRGGTSAGNAVASLLAERGDIQVIPPLRTRRGGSGSRMGSYTVSLAPFVEGADGYTRRMTDGQWRALGATLRAVHELMPPPSVARRIRRERFSGATRRAVRASLRRAYGEPFDDPLAAALARLLRAAADRVEAVMLRADALARQAIRRSEQFVLCHGDLHAGNVHLGADGALYLIDWDTLVFAPREHDFEQVDGAWGGERGARQFYAGYGDVPVDPGLLAYYRYRRVIEDLREICAAVFDRSVDGLNRQQEYDLAERMVRPGGALDDVCARDRAGTA